MRIQLCCGCLAWDFGGTPNCESEGVSDSFASSDTFTPAGLHPPALIQGLCLDLGQLNGSKQNTRQKSIP